ncbi:RNA 2',3'-cyclic phosphodiesterase [Streptomyces sp. NPDC051940]|uniref:RNA 2',3'-cyclic phosphodiesterase n=1 Tax=Streptomyces sp. NPDC051940 TaxID=3155675 RepID=UPI003428FDAD
MRLFAAVIPPPAVLDELAGACAPLRDLAGADALRWTGRDGWHITLAFYGEVAEDDVPELERRLERAASHRAAMGLRIEHAGRFGDRTLWAGVSGDTRELRHLAGAAEAAARKAGLAPRNEHRPYHPHLTLARQGRTGETRLAAYTDALAAFAGRNWTAGELSLVRSHLPHSGVPGEQPRYEVVGGWALGGSG